MLTALLIIATLLGFWILFLIAKYPTPAWVCIGIGAVRGLDYGLLIFTLIEGPL